MYVCLACLLPLTTVGQSITQLADLRTIPFKEWSAKYQSIDKKGKYWNVLYVAEIKTTNGRSMKEDIEMHYVSEYPAIHKNAEWFKWSLLDKCWVKCAKPGIKQENGQTRYIMQTNLPGIYGLMMPQQSKTKGVAIKVPRGYTIENINIKQNNPAISMDIMPKNKSRKVEIPLNDLQFDAKIDVILSNKRKEQFILSRQLAGNYTQFKNQVSSNQYRMLNISTEYITQYEEGVLPLSNR